jgi:hypothetical protein
MSIKQEQLEDIVIEYAKITSSEEYKKYERIMTAMNGKLELIKSELKKKGEKEIVVEKNGEKAEIKFSIRNMNRFNLAIVPLEIKMEYMTESEVWNKEVKYEKNE